MRALFSHFLPLASLLALGACGGGAGTPTGSTSSVVASVPAASVPAVVAMTFDGNVVLGAPTDQSIDVSIFSPTQSGQVFVRYGIDGIAATTTLAGSLQAGQALVLHLANLEPDTRYTYRVSVQSSNGTAVADLPAAGFSTARRPGSTFRFTVQADSHLDENSALENYQATLANIRNDAADFHIDLGDTFMTEKHALPLSATAPPASDSAAVSARYWYERQQFAAFTDRVPLLFANGNHDGELGWLLNGTANSLPVWTSLARLQMFPVPPANAFFPGDAQATAFIGNRRAWYAWHWGDALFIVLDPFWNGTVQPNKDGWNLTLGATQYQWLATTLRGSRARYKFIFLHNLVGGLDGQMRGGVEGVPYFEWGGKNADGSSGFAERRPGWDKPIHQLLVEQHVTAVFKGHDHLYACQLLDGIIYQTVPQPSAVNTDNAAQLARDYHYAAGTQVASNGHLRVTVSAAGVKSEYVRSWPSRLTSSARTNGEIAHRWTYGADGTITTGVP